MSDNEKIKNNKMIAAFMCGKTNKQTSFPMRSHEMWLPYFGVCRIDLKGKHLSYYNDWNWLIPVIGKLSNEGISIEIDYTSIENTYKNVCNAVSKLSIPKYSITKSTKFGTTSLVVNRVHYFLNDIKENTNPKTCLETPYTIQGCFFRGKWVQDTFYITEEFKDALFSAL